ncbi:MAG: hypothetical protein WDZ84_12250 [Rhodovibrionaceae bacterium]
MKEDPLQRELRRILESLARERTTITYRDLAGLAEVPPPQTIHKLAEALEATMRDDHAQGRPLLAALVVSRGASGLPQRGFFELLRSLDRYEGPDSGPQAEAVFHEELALAWDYWGGTSR